MIAKLKRVVKQKKDLLVEILYFLLGSVIGLIVLSIVVWVISREVILPGIAVGGISLSGKNTAQAKQILLEKIESYEQVILLGQTEIKVPKDILIYDHDVSIIEAQKMGRGFNLGHILNLLSGKINLPLVVSINQENFLNWSEQLEGSINISGKPASLTINKGVFVLENGTDGIKLDVESLRRDLRESGEYLSQDKWEVPIQEERMALTSEQERNINARLGELVGKTLIVEVENEKVLLSAKELPSFIDLTPMAAGQVADETVATFVQGLASRYSRGPQDAKFEFEEGKVKEFAPGLDGIAVKQAETARIIKTGIESLLSGEKNVEVKAELLQTPPAVSTAEVNNLGITELIGRGESYYAHSIPNRVFNVGLASLRVTGTLVPPGEEFSFNHAVGEISGATGYKTAYVIQNGRTELGDGGGVCQVSTTLFRAAMNAGLPITERWAHAYRVGYYEQNSKAGIDATVFSPSKDFKFKNDTGNYLLIQAINDPKNLHLIFEIYGTRDGRVAMISTPTVSGVTPPPPDLYQDDPTIPVGQVKQVDWSAWGARASFDYKVERNGEVVFAKTFVSNYKPWANVYLRGTMGQ